MDFKRVVLASGNRGKLAEIRDVLADSGIELVAQSELGIDDAAETGATFVENALLKARHAARASGLPALGDDSVAEIPTPADLDAGIHRLKFLWQSGW